MTDRRPTDNIRMPQRNAFAHYALWVALLVLLTACDQSAQSPVPNRPAPVGVLVSPPAAETTTSTSTDQDTDSRQSLTFWLSADLTLADPENINQLIADNLTQFEQLHPGVDIEQQLKAESGASSLLATLRSAQKVAPGSLPDVVLLNTQDLWVLADLGLAQRIEVDKVTRSEEIYRFALSAVSYNGEYYGVPYTAIVPHAIYDAGKLEQLPQRYDQLLTSRIQYFFPTASPSGRANLSLLTQFVGAGGQLTENPDVTNLEPVADLLEILATLEAEGLLVHEVAPTADPRTLWSAVTGSESAIGYTTSDLFLRQREAEEDIAYGLLPSLQGNGQVVAATWAFAIVTTDPTKQELAYALVQSFLDPGTHSNWSQFAGFLPTSRSAMVLRDDESTYSAFLEDILEDRALAIPAGPIFANFLRSVENA